MVVAVEIAANARVAPATSVPEVKSCDGLRRTETMVTIESEATHSAVRNFRRCNRRQERTRMLAAGNVTTRPETLAANEAGLPEFAELASMQVDVAREICQPAGPVSVIVVAVLAAFKRIAVPVTAVPFVATDVAVVPAPEFDPSKLKVVEPVPPV